jgi:hypothetical protein
MKIVIQTMGILFGIALGAASAGCSPSAAAPDPAPERAAAAERPPGAAPGTQAMASTTEAKIEATTEAKIEAKLSAPVDVTLTSSARTGTVVITLSLTAQADIPRGVGRIVLPKEVRLVGGQTQVDLGALKRGVVSQYQVTVEVPSTGQFRIFAGVDCRISSGVLIHKGARELVLGQ